jgi:TolB-like protein
VGVLAVVLLQMGGSNESHALAVLPFVNDSGDPDAEYLSDGITESLIGHLSPIDDNLAEAHTSLASVRTSDWDWQGAERE